MHKPLIAVIGDARIDSSSNKYRLAEELGRCLVDNGYRVVTGGLHGVMEAASKGAASSDKHQNGDILGILPGFDPTQANTYVDICIPTGLDMSRNSVVANVDAVVAIGGGAGTLSEIAHAWSLFRLVIAYRDLSGWSGKLADTKIDERCRYPEIAEDCVYGVTSAVEVIGILNKYLDKYTRRHTQVK